jgi:hypothetical protein
MKEKKRWFALIGCAAAVMIAVLAGCQNPASDPGTAEGPRDAEPAESPASSVEVEKIGGNADAPGAVTTEAESAAEGDSREPAAEGAVVYRYESVTEMRAALAALPENTPETPYLVKLGSGVSFGDADMRGTVTVYGKTYDDPLMGLFSAPSGRYVALDLTGISDAVKEIPEGENKRALDGYVEPNDYVVAITLPSWVSKIGHDAFHKLTRLEYINLEDTELTELGDNALAGTGLRSLTLPETLTSLGLSAFSKSRQLRSVDMGSLAITEIPGGCFYECTALREIVWPPHLETIEYRAFAGAGFVTLTIPPTVKTIGGGAFGDNDNLVWFKWPEAPAEASGYMMLSYCENLVRVQYPPTMGGVLTSVNFQDCASLETVILPWEGSAGWWPSGTIPLHSGDDAFDGVPGNIKVYVPDGRVDAYRKKWSSMSNGSAVIRASPEIISPLSALTDVPENWTTPGTENPGVER